MGDPIPKTPQRRPRQERDHLFVLKLWPEERSFEGKAPVWRGAFTNIDGSNTRYFDHISGLARLLREAVGAESMFAEDDGHRAAQSGGAR